MKTFNLSDIDLTKYLFFTGKGGVGKTSIACATAVGLADNGKKILLISTDPASNLQDVFNQTLNGHGTDIQEVPGLTVVNLDPEQAAAEYRESVITPFRGQLPESVIQNMEEQLSGSCTVEIAAFNQFSDFITDANKAKEYDHIIFDTAPTGHTLRMLQLPSAWSTFISESTHGASCLGQLSGLEERKGIYKQAVETLSDANATRLVLVSRPEIAPLKEAARSSHELQLLGIKNQLLVINGLLLQLDEADSVSKQIYDRQQNALKQTPAELLAYPSYYVPLRSYNLSNIANIRRMLHDDNLTNDANYQRITDAKGLDELVNDLYQSGKRVVFTMGKGGVGKTVTVCNLAALMAQDGKRVLVVDMDAQGNCTYTLTGARVTDNTFDRAGVYDMFRAYGISGTQNYISRTQFDNIDIIPANGNTPMAAKQLQILEQSESTSINMFLAMCLAQVAGEYDFILIDTPPSRDVMVTNALMASDFVLIPCVCDDYSRDSVYRTVAMCQQLEHDEGEKIDVLGIILTMVEKTALTEVIRNELRESQLGSKLFAAEIRKGQAVKDSTRLGAPVVLCARSSNPAKDYAKVYAELKTRVEQEAE